MPNSERDRQHPVIKVEEAEANDENDDQEVIVSS